MINGSAGNDVLTGTDGNDTIDGEAGHDSINGGLGNDYLNGGKGSDTVAGGDGADTVRGWGDSSGVSDNDELYGESGKDRLTYSAGSGSHSILLDGGSGDDWLTFESQTTSQAVKLVGGDGNDTIDIDRGGTVNVDAGAGIDRINFSYSEYGLGYSFALGAGADLLFLNSPSPYHTAVGPSISIADFDTSATGDRLIANGFFSHFTGWDRNANLFATGHLLLEQRGGDTVLRVDLNGGGNELRDLVLFEEVASGSLTDYHLGFSPDGGLVEAGTQDGSGGVDLLVGFAGSDHLRGLAGRDELFGGAGNDSLEGGSDEDTLDGGFGDDILEGGESADTLLDANGGNDQFFGEDGNDTLYIWRVGSATAGAVMMDGGTGNDDLTFISYTAQLSGSAHLIGGEGNDYIYTASAVSAVVDAGSGDDTVSIVNAGTSYAISLGAGTDKLILSGGRKAGSPILIGDFEAGDPGDRLDLQSYLTQVLTGWDGRANPYDAGYLRLVQRDGDAVLQMDVDGAAGALAFGDLLTLQGVSAASLTTQNLGGYATFTGLAGDDRLEGDAGNNTLSGNGGNDTLIGHSGDDNLDGGPGKDVMMGGQGDDVYVVDDVDDQVIEDGWVSAKGDEVRTNLSLYVQPAEIERIVGTSAVGQTLIGHDGFSVIYGTAGSDTILAGDGPNAAYGQAGDDRLEGGRDGDFFYGGAGADTLLGGAGDDTLQAGEGPGDDLADGGEGDDRIEGSFGSDTLLGGSGADYLYDGSAGSDVLDGGDGDDQLTLTRFQDDLAALPVSISGGAGADRAALVIGNNTAVSLDMGAGADEVEILTFSGKASIRLGGDQDTLRFSGFYPSLDPARSIFVTDFTAGAEGDRLAWTDFLTKWLQAWDGVTNPFSTGHVALVQRGGSSLVQVDRDGGADAFIDFVTFQNLNAATLTQDNLEFAPAAGVKGTAGADLLQGTAGDDSFNGGAGDDRFNLQHGGDDGAVGGLGNDVFLFGASLTPADQVDGGDGADLVAVQGDYSTGLTLGAGSLTGIDTLTPISGRDARFGDTGGNLYSYRVSILDEALAAGHQLKLNGAALLAGESLSFNGSGETNGSFFIYGGHGADDLTGGSGADVFFFAEGRLNPDDTFDGGVGADILVLRGNYAGGNALTFAANSMRNVETITLMSASDTRFFTGGVSYGYDVQSHEGNVAAGKTVTVNGGKLLAAETVRFEGSAETDGHFRLFAGSGNDSLSGGAGNDLIYGGLGADVLTGNGGADVFRYQSTMESTLSARDTIDGFVAGTDRIDLSRIDADNRTGSDDAFTFVEAQSFRGIAGELRAFQSNGSWFVEADVDGDGSADLVIQVNAAQSLTAGDFLL